MICTNKFWGIQNHAMIFKVSAFDLALCRNSLQLILLIANMDVSRTKRYIFVLVTSTLAKSNIGQRELYTSVCIMIPSSLVKGTKLLMIIPAPYPHIPKRANSDWWRTKIRYTTWFLSHIVMEHITVNYSFMWNYSFLSNYLLLLQKKLE
jgi:hypothetical protein